MCFLLQDGTFACGLVNTLIFDVKVVKLEGSCVSMLIIKMMSTWIKLSAWIAVSVLDCFIFLVLTEVLVIFKYMLSTYNLQPHASMDV